MPKARSFDQHAIRELGLFIENDSQLYHSQQLPIEKNLKIKGMKGTYDPRLAVKLWSYLIESGRRSTTSSSARPGAPGEPAGRGTTCSRIRCGTSSLGRARGRSRWSIRRCSPFAPLGAGPR